MAVKNTTLGNVNLAEARLATKRTDVYSDLSADWLFDLLKKTHLFIYHNGSLVAAWGIRFLNQ